MRKPPKPQPADTTPPAPERKSPEEIDQAALLDTVQAQAETIELQQSQMEDFMDLVNDLKSRVEAQEDAGEEVVRESDVFIDPYEGHDGLDFVCQVIPPDSNFEFGRQLKWINPKLRSEIGMRGWEPVKFGASFLLGEVKDLETSKVSEVPGAKLGDYLKATPSRMEGSDRRDDHIRRGDLILCWIDMKIYIARMRRRDEDAMKKRILLSNENDQLDVHGRRGAHVIGPGLTRNSDSRQPQSTKSTYVPADLDAIVKDGLAARGKAPLSTTPTPPPQE